ncbi:hypothetical protein RUM44_009601 [Polyplax serrata]|uniref:Small ribosomal subunit protein mS35 mitochondrial conserved domain-containing protein n=1 Tax=Polyplax serrata TaxID=468196 RepID=A0ABR1AT66_POLSC
MASSVRWVLRLKPEAQFLDVIKVAQNKFVRYYTEQQHVQEDEEGFRVLDIWPPKKAELKKKEQVVKMAPPRTQKMKPSQDWTNIWPAQRTFHPAVVPLPVRQGRNKHGPPPHKYANTELMKIPNFLHLTPPAIKKHCEALKQFCTPWPSELETEEDMEKHFPFEIVASDYCHSSPSIRDPLSRIISLKVKLKNLELDEHAKDKFLRLVGDRYDPKTDYVTITTDSCPLKKQNYDYAQYLITALLFESWKCEDWEKLKSNADMEKYIFSERQISENVKQLFEYNNKEMPDTTEFAAATENWYDNGDSSKNIEEYKKATLKLLSLPVH